MGLTPTTGADRRFACLRLIGRTSYNTVQIRSTRNAGVGSCLVQRYFTMTMVNQFATASKAGELERHWQWVNCVQSALTTSLEKIMGTGDMDLFAKTLHEQASLPNLQEASLTDFKGIRAAAYQV